MQRVAPEELVLSRGDRGGLLSRFRASSEFQTPGRTGLVWRRTGFAHPYVLAIERPAQAATRCVSRSRGRVSSWCGPDSWCFNEAIGPRTRVLARLLPSSRFLRDYLRDTVTWKCPVCQLRLVMQRSKDGRANSSTRPESQEQNLAQIRVDAPPGQGYAGRELMSSGWGLIGGGRR